MQKSKIYKAIGLMSGTSLDGIDVALIETDGFAYVKPLDFAHVPYGDEDREVLRSALGRTDYDNCTRTAEALLTDLHIKALRDFGYDADVIGFHGQTLFHDPDNGCTFQIGDGALMAKEMGITVVNDFRSQDISNGGQGAPLLPLYHRALVEKTELEKPVCILNIGGVSNVTFIGDNDEILAFDCGAGNALMDDFMLARTGKVFDKNGDLARKGKVDTELLESWMAHPYFAKSAPKSLDRDVWDVGGVEGLSTEDGLATLNAFTVEAIVRGVELLPQKPQHWYVCGGGRHNAYLMESLCAKLGSDVQPVEALGWDGDALEAEGFAYLAVRSILGQPSSLPTTTGVRIPITGGVQHHGKTSD